MNGEDAEDRLYGLMEIAERQQAAVQAALEGLAAERAALARERETFAREVRLLEIGVRTVVQRSVTEGFAAVGTEGVAAVTVATQPLMVRLESITDGAKQAEAAVQRVVSWASWRLLGWIMGLMAALMLIGWFANTAVIWWDSGQVHDLRAQVAQLSGNRDTWMNAGLLSRITFCDPGHRPCVAIDERPGPFGPAGGPDDYRVLKGY